MMWPILTKVEYEALPKLFQSRQLYIHIIISLFLNWIVGPFIMLGLAWATLPDLPTYRTGVIMVGLARCIAMVMIWNQLAGGDANYCAILVVINSVLQIILYSPFSLLFVNIIGGEGPGSDIHLAYGDVAISVLIVSIPANAILVYTHMRTFSISVYLCFLVSLHAPSSLPSHHDNSSTLAFFLSSALSPCWVSYTPSW